MKISNYRVLFLGLYLFSAIPIYAGEFLWLSNYQDALERGRKEKKLILVDFSGSDWSKPCRDLVKEVFSQDSFIDYAKKYLVLLQLDFPQRALLPARLAKQNEELKKKYRVNYFPTIFLLDPRGNPIWKGGYIEGGAKNYIEYLMAAISAKNLFDMKRKEFAALDPKDKKNLQKNFETLVEIYQIGEKSGLLTDLSWILSMGSELDESLKEGFFLVRKIKRLFVEKRFKEARQLMQKLLRWDPENKKRYYEEVAINEALCEIDSEIRPSDAELLACVDKIQGLFKKVPNLSSNALMQYNMLCADFSVTAGRIEQGIKFFKQAREKATDSRTRQEIGNIITQLLKKQVMGSIE
ncbi:thioredoxin family protein [Candidatus Riflebacteria bacterium]